MYPNTLHQGCDQPSAPLLLFLENLPAHTGVNLSRSVLDI